MPPIKWVINNETFPYKLDCLNPTMQIRYSQMTELIFALQHTRNLLFKLIFERRLAFSERFISRLMKAWCVVDSIFLAKSHNFPLLSNLHNVVWDVLCGLVANAMCGLCLKQIFSWHFKAPLTVWRSVFDTKKWAGAYFVLYNKIAQYLHCFGVVQFPYIIKTTWMVLILEWIISSGLLYTMKCCDWFCCICFWGRYKENCIFSHFASCTYL